MDPRVKALRQAAPAVFGFLVRDHGFSAPEEIDDGLLYIGAELMIEITVRNWNRETGFSTRLRHGLTRADLGELYVRLGLGPAQDVGASASSGHTVRKRVAEHGAALARVLAAPGLADALARH